MSIYPPVRDEMIRLLSVPRLSTYTRACDGDVKRALELYQWNLEISGTLFSSIHYFEVALRNSLDTQLTKTFASAQTAWYDQASIPLNDGGKKAVRRAKGEVARAGHEVTPGRVVAELSLGFWWSLLADGYNRSLWEPALKDGFRNARRATLHEQIDHIRRLRNRIAHHEPLIHHDLPAEYTRILQTAERVTSRLAWWIDATSSLSGILDRRPAMTARSEGTADVG